MDNMMEKIKDGFPNQRMVVVSRELIRRIKKMPIAKCLYVTDIGHFPKTRSHSVYREEGSKQYIMIFCATGKGVVRIQGAELELTTGQLIIIPPGIPHKYEADQATPWNIYWFHFAGSQASEYQKLLGINERRPTMQVADGDALIRQFESLYAVVVSAFTDSALVQASVELSKMLCLINSLRTGRHRKSRKSEQRILASIEYITNQYAAPHTLEELACNAGLSVPHYVTLFRQQTGTSPIRYLTRVRLRHACELLDLSDKPVADIARSVGYEDAFYFSRVFRNSTGHSPTTYRKLHKG
jgi:AraC-like DNA-binding protein